MTKANSCSTIDTIRTSSSSLRYFTIAGINQLKSKRASSPTSDAREASRIKSPVQCSENSSNDIQTGCADIGRCISSRVPASVFSTRPTMAKSPDVSLKIAGVATFSKRSGFTWRCSANRPRWRAACRIAFDENPAGDSPNSWSNCAASVAIPCARAIVTRQLRPVGNGASSELLILASFFSVEFALADSVEFRLEDFSDVIEKE